MTILILSSIIISICNIILFCVQRKINKLVQEQLELINKRYDSSMDFCNMMSTLNELQRKQIILEEQLAAYSDPYFLHHHRSFQQERKHNE